ncbi:hypothetical protein Tcan_05369 [Toxocara canis]|uniref:Uncharacterized protein n=1 Tax=Toxocara canis TaxID=6265 RepID=A0A0B2VUG1_TOXCA|nr:hypothetical protein Tcan_05369 [Toxocara canis]
MLFSSTGSLNVKHRRLVIVEQKETEDKSDSSISGRCSSLLGRINCVTESYPDYTRLLADSHLTDSPAVHSRISSRSNSRTEELRPGHWTILGAKVRLQALSASEQRRVLNAQKNQLAAYTNFGGTTLQSSQPVSFSSGRRNI